jgi:hypothetical protein
MHIGLSSANHFRVLWFQPGNIGGGKVQDIIEEEAARPPAARLSQEGPGETHDPAAWQQARPRHYHGARHGARRGHDGWAPSGITRQARLAQRCLDALSRLSPRALLVGAGMAWAGMALAVLSALEVIRW